MGKDRLSATLDAIRERRNGYLEDAEAALDRLDYLESMLEEVAAFEPGSGAEGVEGRAFIVDQVIRDTDGSILMIYGTNAGEDQDRDIAPYILGES